MYTVVVAVGSVRRDIEKDKDKAKTRQGSTIQDDLYTFLLNLDIYRF